MQILGFPDYTVQAQALAAELNAAYAEVQVHHFPDGESRVTVPPSADPYIVLCRSLDHPNDKLVELALTVDVLRKRPIERICLVAPYLCYMRQDAAFNPGEAVSQQVLGNWLGQLVDDLITVDPHLHRVQSLQQVVPGARTCTLHATLPLGDFLAGHCGDALLLGPDEESEQWVSAIAGRHGLRYGVCRKQRQGDHTVRIELPHLDIGGRTLVLIDDMVSTGRTLIQAAHQLHAAGAQQVYALVTHVLCTDESMQNMQDAGIAAVWSTDSIPHPSNRVPLAPLLAQAVSVLD